MIDKTIIQVAAHTKNYGLKNIYPNKAICKNRICGDRIIVELKIKNKIIQKMRYELDACIFCLSSASLLSKVVSKINTSVWKSEIKEFQQSKRFDNTIMCKKMPILKKLFVTKYIDRFDCIILPFNALEKAINVK